MLYESCDKREDVVAAVLRRPYVRIPAIAFDVGCKGIYGEKNEYGFRNASGYKIELKSGRTLERLPSMDICEVAWDALTLVLCENEKASYTVMNVFEDCPLFIEAETDSDTTVNIYENESLLSYIELKAGDNIRQEVGRLKHSDDCQITIEVIKGCIRLHALCFGDVKESHYDGFLEMEIPQP